VTLNLRQFGNALRGWFGWPTEHNGTVVKWYADDAHWSMIRDDGQDAMLFRNGALVSEWTVAFYESADSFGPAALWTQVLSPSECDYLRQEGMLVLTSKRPRP
jgi:hypothetical protein